MDRVDRDVAERQVFVVIAIGVDVATAGLQPHFDVQLATFADGGDVHVAIEHFHIRISLDHAADDFTRLIGAQADGTHTLTHHLERNLLQVEDDVSGVFDNSWNGTEFVSNSVDANGGNGRAFNG